MSSRRQQPIKEASSLSEDQQYCYDMLKDWAHGRHHLPKNVYKFGTGICINVYGDLSTFDSDRLTRLVLLAHAYFCRVEICGSGPGMVKVIVHRRKEQKEEHLRYFEKHPSLRDLAATAIALADNYKNEQREPRPETDQPDPGRPGNTPGKDSGAS